jgi:hypothetical protein
VVGWLFSLTTGIEKDNPTSGSAPASGLRAWWWLKVVAAAGGNIRNGGG